MFTVLGFSFGWFALAVVVAVIDVLTMALTIAVTVYGSLAIIGVLVFSVIGIRRLIADRTRVDPTPPIVVADDPDCKFYRSAADALAAGFTPTTKVFDAQGHRLLAAGNKLRMSSSDPDGAVELAEVLRRWLGYMDAIRWSTADMELELLVQASVEHLGYSR